MLNFVLGLILGILIRDIKCGVVKTIQDIEKTQQNKGETQFIESISFKEKFKNAKNVSDLL